MFDAPPGVRFRDQANMVEKLLETKEQKENTVVGDEGTRTSTPPPPPLSGRSCCCAFIRAMAEVYMFADSCLSLLSHGIIINGTLYFACTADVRGVNIDRCFVELKPCNPWVG